ncbi:MAG TPA: tyrosine-type recombinase/integrase [Pseudonocardiaceae bacterium]|nr:tyrosine-type recombinase/integrase [Pseudonocardiaceae bacterium]
MYGASFDEVRKKLDKLKGDSVNGVLVPDRSTSLREYLEYWPHEIASHKRATTMRGYESAVRLRIVPVLGIKRLDKLTGADVRHLIAVCRQKCLCCTNGYDKNREEAKRCCPAGRCCGRTPSRRQIQYIHAALRNALNNAEREELITRNVAKLVQIPTPRYKVGKGIPVSDVKRILSVAKGTRFNPVYVLAATLGLRRGELLNTHWEGIRAQAGLPGVRLHDLRHTVSLLLELGTPPHVVQAIARHADLDVTMRIYAHTNLDTMREALDKIDWDAG